MRNRDVEILINKDQELLVKEEMLKNHTWMMIGGLCKNFIVPRSKEQLIDYLSSKTPGDEFFVLGAGSNILIDDSKPFETFVSTSKLRGLDVKDGMIEADAGVLLANLSSFAKKNKIAGFEFMVGIPGSVGGSVKMNAGAWGSDISEHLHSIKVWKPKVGVSEVFVDDLAMSYRTSNIRSNHVVLSAKFKIKQTDTSENIEKLIREIKNKRAKSQPIVKGTGGSTFRNPKDGLKAWQLIKEAKADKIIVGDMTMSDKHANFMINRGQATFHDAITLGEEIKKSVYDKFNINLKWEIVRLYNSQTNLNNE